MYHIDYDNTSYIGLSRRLVGGILQYAVYHEADMTIEKDKQVYE